MTKQFISFREFARRENVSDTLVRRAIREGRLHREDNGKLDASLVGSPWCERNAKFGPAGASSGANTSANTSANTANTNSNTRHIRDALQAEDDETLEDTARRGVVEAETDGLIPDYAESLAKKEHYLALLRELEYGVKRGQLIELDLAEDVMFELGRNCRDHWTNFVPRFAAMIAADLGLEADKVTEVLNGYVYRHQLALADPQSGEFRNRD